MRIVYRITKEDFLEAQRTYQSSSISGFQRLFRKTMIGFGLALICIGVVFLFLPSPVYRKEASPSIIAGPLLLFLFWLAPGLAARKAFSKQCDMQKEIVAEFSDSGTHISSGDSSSTISWADYVRYAESEHQFILFRSTQLFNVIPKRAFSSDEVEEFRTLLSGKLPK